MKKLLLSSLVFVIINLTIAQNVGINAVGSAPNTSAGLDVDFNDKGILIPRVALTGTNDLTTVPTPATSLLVYNTATAGTGSTAVTPGYYYWNGTQWLRLLNTGNAGGMEWLLNGNAGTSAGTDFVGTTDAQDLVFKTNNTEYVRITTNGNIGVGTPTPSNTAVMDLSSVNKGLLIPRMTTAQRNAIISPSHSLLIFNTTTNCIQIYNNGTSIWEDLYCLCYPVAPPSANAASGITQTNFTANWSFVSGATSYLLDVATDATFSSPLPGYSNLNVGNINNYSITGLSCGVTYYYRIRSIGCDTSGYSNVITVNTTPCCPSSYTVTSIPYSWTSFSGSISSSSSCDDCVSSAVAIGFNFCFYGTTYTDVYISSNGFITFLTGQPNGCCSGIAIPNASNPNGFIAGLWTDLHPSCAGTISYGTIGAAPNRVFIVEFSGVDEYSCSNSNSFQIKLYETSNIIEIHAQQIQITGHVATIGVENQTGSAGTSVPGFNAVTPPFTSNTAWRFQ